MSTNNAGESVSQSANQSIGGFTGEPRYVGDQVFNDLVEDGLTPVDVDDLLLSGIQQIVAKHTGIQDV
jgi:hypothetical protein